MGKPQCPGSGAYIEANRESVKPARPPSNVEHAGPIAIRWMTETDEDFGFSWSMEILIFEPNERIFDRKTYEDDKVYRSLDTRTYLDRDATCASAGLRNDYRVFATSQDSESLSQNAPEGADN